MARKDWAAIVAVAVSLVFPAEASALPPGFFGVAPQTPLTSADAEYMSAGGVESIRVMMSWPEIQPSAYSGYQWQGFDAIVALAARAHLTVLPVLMETPSWLADKPTSLPVDTPEQRREWSAFVHAAVERYGPQGRFWDEHGPSSFDPVPKMPIRAWQIWNEVNFFYFAYPVSPNRYAKLLTLAHAAVKAVDPGARVILSGLFGKPEQGGRRGMPAVKFLASLYRIRGIKPKFDGIALHPYAVSVAKLKAAVESIRRVANSHDDRVPLYLTEVGWGSQDDFSVDAFEQGIEGQARDLRDAYRYLISNQSRLHVAAVYWFSWKDLSGSCDFCDSVGLFEEGPGFAPKPAWRSFVAITGGRLSPYEP